YVASCNSLKRGGSSVKRMLSLVLLLSLTATLAAGCSGGNKQNEPSASSQPAASSQSAASPQAAASESPSAEPTPAPEIRVSVVDNWFAQAPYSDKLAVFQELEKKTGIKVKWEALPDEQYRSTIKTRIAAGNDLADLVEGGDDASLL